jgi:hypothetical protein
MSKRRKPNSTKPGPPTPTAILAKARRQAAAANRAAQRDPDNHELRVRAFALAATVKTIEGVIGER